MGLRGAAEHHPIKICANEFIGCGGDINQSDFVGLCGSTQVCMGVYMGLCRSTQRSMRVYAEVYTGLHGSTQRSMRVYAGLGNIIQSKYVPMMSLAVVGTLTNQILWVYEGLCGSTWGSMWFYAGVYVGLGNIIQSKSVPLSVVRSIKCPPLFAPGYHWLPLTTIDIVGDNREFEVLRHFLRCYTHYNWLMVLELQMSITVCPWLSLVAPSNHGFGG